MLDWHLLQKPLLSLVELYENVHTQSDISAFLTFYIAPSQPPGFLVMAAELTTGGLRHWNQEDVPPLKTSPSLKKQKLKKRASNAVGMDRWYAIASHAKNTTLKWSPRHTYALIFCKFSVRFCTRDSIGCKEPSLSLASGTRDHKDCTRLAPAACLPTHRERARSKGGKLAWNNAAAFMWMEVHSAPFEKCSSSCLVSLNNAFDNPCWDSAYLSSAWTFDLKTKVIHLWAWGWWLTGSEEFFQRDSG